MPHSLCTAMTASPLRVGSLIEENYNHSCNISLCARLPPHYSPHSFFGGGVSAVHAQEVVLDTVTFAKAKVTQVLSEEEKKIPGTETSSIYQTIVVEVLEGEDMGKVLTLDNDYLLMKVGDVFYVRHSVNTADGTDFYSVGEPYRLPILIFVVVVFLIVLAVFGGRQGLRGLLALVASFFFIAFLLLPGMLKGYSPVLVSMGVASLIITLGSYITHGFNRTTTAAVFGMLATIVFTGALAYWSIYAAQLSGFTSEEITALNFATRGSLDLVGLLLGSMLIGLLGVLYDAAISQAIAVEELLRAGTHLSRTHITTRALRIGREHIGALVNILAIAYVGASLPLLLLLKLNATQSFLMTVNQELFAAELLRTMVGSIGLILAVPFTTLIAVWMLYGRDFSSAASSGHTHHH